MDDWGRGIVSYHVDGQRFAGAAIIDAPKIIKFITRKLSCKPLTSTLKN